MYLTNDMLKNDSLFEVYGESFTKQISKLENEIFKYSTGKGKFKVLSLEAGIGKSRYTDLIIKSYIQDTVFEKEQKKFLIVKKFNSEARQSAEFINNIDWIANDVVVAIDRDNWKDYWKDHIGEMKDIQVLIISHARYINLSNNANLRKNFEDGREILVIDEKIQFQPLIYRDSLYSKVREIIDFDHRDLLDDVCKPLGKYINEQFKNKKYRQVHKIRFNISPEKLEELIEYLNDFLVLNTLTTKQRNLIEALRDGLPFWYNNMNVFNYDNIATNHTEQNYWGLKGNNIILDASAKLDGVYKVNKDKFKLINTPKIIDHGNSTFHVHKYNSSKTNVKKDKEEYLKEIIEKASKTHVKGEKTLLIGYRDLAKDIQTELHKHVDSIWLDKMDKEKDSDYNNESFAISWYGNLVGRNEFKNFDNIWLLTTPNLPMNHYPVHYMLYAEKSIGQNKLNLKSGRFNNSTFNNLHRGYVRSEVYQSLKRIQRNSNPSGTFHLVMNDMDLINSVLGELKNASLHEENIHELDFVVKRKQEKNDNKPTSKGELASEYLLNCGESEVSKKFLKQKFGITNWNTQIAKNPSFIELKRNQVIKESSNKRSILINF